jgi:hypothetical protein
LARKSFERKIERRGEILQDMLERYESERCGLNGQRGTAWGGGLYANCASALVWGADGAGWWARPAAYRARPAAAEWAVQGVLGFMAVNATIVFGRGATRGAGLAACAGIAAGALAARRRAGRRAG